MRQWRSIPSCLSQSDPLQTRSFAAKHDEEKYSLSYLCSHVLHSRTLHAYEILAAVHNANQPTCGNMTWLASNLVFQSSARLNSQRLESVSTVEQSIRKCQLSKLTPVYDILGIIQLHMVDISLFWLCLVGVRFKNIQKNSQIQKSTAVHHR